MRRQWLTLVCLAVLLIAHNSWAERSGLYTGAGGVIIVQNDAATARQRALEGALRAALENAVGALLTAESLAARPEALRTRVYERPFRYVRSYRVLWEYADNPYYRVGVEAEVDMRKVRYALADLDLVAPPALAQSALSLFITIAERRLGQTDMLWPGSRGIVNRALRQHLVAKGVRVVNPDPAWEWDRQEASALEAAQKAGVDAVCVGWAGVEQTYNAVTGAAVSATAQVQVFDTATGQPFATERVEKTVLNNDGILADEQALEEVAEGLAARLLAPLQARGQSLER